MKRLRLGILLLPLGVVGFLVACSAIGGSSAKDVGSTSPATVSHVADGDTLVVRYAGRTGRVRILGINSPELGQCYAAQATAQARRLVAGKRVSLVRDRSQASRDRFGRLLVYVLAPAGDVGQILVEGGYAEVYVYNRRPFGRVDGYRRAERAAKADRRGLWGTCGGFPPRP